MNFLEKLNFLMNTHGINKSTLAKESGIPYTTIDAWYKKGYEGLKLTTLRKLASFFDTTLDYLVIDEIEDMNYGKLNNEEKQEDMGIVLYNQLDANDKAEIRGEMKQMLKSDKYLEQQKKTSKIEFASELTPSNEDIEQELASYRLELEAEQKGRISSASNDAKNA